ncbi:MAG TPA: trehalose-6-phosphate synthase, partial [Methylocella sp.]|nr:trehalose-6-phosphate synthase [Methylocella sp.]
AAEKNSTVKRMLASLEGRDLVIGVDRLDYSKGLKQRMAAFATFLERSPQAARTRVTMLQITPKSRSEVPEYARMQRDLEEEPGRINGKLGDVDWTPLRIKETIEEVIEDLSDHVDQPPASAPAPEVVESFALEMSGGPSLPSSAPSPAPIPALNVEVRPSDLPPGGLMSSEESERPVLCIAGRSFLDEAAAALFVQILETHGMRATIEPAGALTAGRRWPSRAASRNPSPEPVSP